MAQVLFKPAAERDVAHLVHYSFSQRIEVAGRFHAAIEDACKRLADSPELGGRIASDSEAVAGMRMWPVPGFRSYLIFYRPLSAGVEVVRILHGARDWLPIIEAQPSAD